MTDLYSEQDYFNHDTDIVDFRNINQMLEELLDAQRTEAIILSTGTVLKKLLKAGIRPDYVIIIDGNEGVYRQISRTYGKYLT